MRKSKFTEAQIVAMVRESEAEGVTIEQVAKKHGLTPMAAPSGARREELAKHAQRRNARVTASAGCAG